MIGILLLFLAAIFLSAFFSGMETGFYRAVRVRLVLDGMSGDKVASSLLWMTNNPTLFVATTLIGNNLANYLASLAVVLGVHLLANPAMPFADVMAAIMLAPVVFVYGELLPKKLFFHAPNKLLRRGGPLLIISAVLFAPVTAVLWILGRLLASLLGETPLQVQLTLARKELQKIFQEGESAGVLQPVQRQVAQGIFSIGADPVITFGQPVDNLLSVPQGTKRTEVLRLARRHDIATVLVRDKDRRDLIGYLRIIDLDLAATETVDQVRPLLKFDSTESYLATVISLQSAQEELAAVTDQEGQITNIIYLRDLVQPLFRTDQ
ncbi:MAG: CNNM domain-containing protein [Pirellulaceae bacterium]